MRKIARQIGEKARRCAGQRLPVWPSWMGTYSPLVIERTQARVIARFGPGAIAQPSRATALRVLEDLERRHPLFRLSAKSNWDIADRPKQVYGKLRPMRPGEYLLMDTTRLDVFAFDPFTLKWIQAELNVSMDWYTRCITGLRLTLKTTALTPPCNPDLTRRF